MKTFLERSEKCKKRELAFRSMKILYFEHLLQLEV